MTTALQSHDLNHSGPEQLFAGALSFLIRKTPHSFLMAFDLKTLFKGLPVISFKGNWRGEVLAISTDSRRVTPGSLFFALPGLNTDGNQFIEEAIDRGAVAIVSEKAPRIHGDVLFIQVENIRSILAEVARRFYQNPEKAIDLVGITGTNGKTTVAFLTQFLLSACGDRTGMLGTVKYDLGGRTLPAYRTTPDAVDIYAMLAQMRDSACRYGILEVSSHGIDQQRVDRMPVKVAAFLNLTQDHIDYHQNIEDYFDAKARLFDGRTGCLPEVSVINMDDPYGRRLCDLVPPDTRVITFGRDPEADLAVSKLELDSNGARFSLSIEGRNIPVSTSLLGLYNVYNILAAFGICHALGFDIKMLAKKIAAFPGVPGRMERVDEGQSYNVLVDYAHTDDALKNALGMLRHITPGRLLVVFGCGGNRDRKKRPLMTRAVMEGCDLCWATSDNPRGETPAAIFADMKTAVTDPARIAFVESRRRAISLALDEAKEGDCVLIAGKGHETFQEFADTVAPFDDRQVARELLEIKQLGGL